MMTKPSQLDLAALEIKGEDLSIRRAVLAHAVAYIVAHGDDESDCEFCAADFCDYALTTKVDGPYSGFFAKSAFSAAFFSDGVSRCQEAGFFDTTPEGLHCLNVAAIEAAIEEAKRQGPIAEAA